MCDKPSVRIEPIILKNCVQASDFCSGVNDIKMKY